MKPIIKVENLSKRYRIGATRLPYQTLRETLTQTVRKPLNWFNGNGKSEDNTIWALKDVSFEVMPGEVVGVIGRNGAGKSTLLKILSRITDPTSGQIDLYGRVGSLLEVGTGFHAELTGRENIFLNGAILGMKRNEIGQRFDEIVSFAEIEKFVDTPVKHYSSGMYMRLAFSVAANLNPDILIIDEVLAVGDTAFQRKCLGKISEVAQNGRTVLFVSHNMGAVSHLCSTGILLEKARTLHCGGIDDTISYYNSIVRKPSSLCSTRFPNVIYEAEEEMSSSDFLITKIEMLDKRGIPNNIVRTWDDVVFRIWYSCKRSVLAGSVVLELLTREGIKLVTLSTQPDSVLPLAFKTGLQYVDCLVNKLPLASGEYFVGAGLAIPNLEWLWHRTDLGILTVMPKDVYRSGLAPSSPRSLLAVNHEWKSAL